MMLNHYKISTVNSRTPSGVRGLKSQCRELPSSGGQSHPVRGAWIEIEAGKEVTAVMCCRTPSGVRGLKLLIIVSSSDFLTVAPRQGCVD